MKSRFAISLVPLLAVVFFAGCAHSPSNATKTEEAPKIDKDSIRAVIQKNLKPIKACYVKELNLHPGLSGKLVLEWDIGDAGKVVKARVKSSELKDAEVGNCVVARLQTWTFPEPPKNNEITVSFPFFFSE